MLEYPTCIGSIVTITEAAINFIGYIVTVTEAEQKLYRLHRYHY
jgi:hypothetical protein